MTRGQARIVGRSGLRVVPALLLLFLVACSDGGTATPVPPSTATTAPPTATSAVAQPTALPAQATVAATPTVTLPGSKPAATPGVRGPLMIFAASSLTDAFSEMKVGFARAYPDVAITFNFGASSELKAQLEQGARADLYAPADIPQMEGAKGKGLIAGEARIFANNKLALIVPANNPRGIAAPQDVARPGTKLILAAVYVPIGSYARLLFAKMAGDPAYGPDFYKRSLANIASEEVNTRAVVNRIALGEGDAGIVYASDVTPAVSGQVRVIPIPEKLQIIAQYPIALVNGVANEAAARAFIAYVLSPEGQATLLRNGFITVGPTGASPAPIPKIGSLAKSRASRSVMVLSGRKGTG